MTQKYDALLIVSFGGPESPEEVVPFLENVTRGKDIPRERLKEVGQHYFQFGGKSPLNQQNRALVAALVDELNAEGPLLPVYWGNRNWHPLLADTLRQMQANGVKRALAFFTSAFSSYSGCRQYLEDIERAREEVGAGAPEIEKLRAFYNHPGFIEPMIERANLALEKIPPERRESAAIFFTAHSVPLSMVENCQYQNQLEESCRLVAAGLGRDNWRLVFQSRSGPPTQPWLEPDICDVLNDLAGNQQTKDVVIVPIGFISDHMEVIYDLDTEARQVCQEQGLNMVRAATVGTDPKFIRMIRQLMIERISEQPERLALGTLGPSHDVCPQDCCRYTPQRPARNK